MMVIQGFCYLLQTYCHGYADFKIFAYAEHREIPFSRPKMTIRFSPLFGLRFKNINFSGDFGILMKKLAVEISVFLIIDLSKYHFLHRTEGNPSFDYYDVLVSDIFSNMKNLNLKMN